MVHYKCGKTRLYMDTGNKKEWLSLYVVDPLVKTSEHTLAMRLTRKAAWALVQEINARLFGEDEKAIGHYTTLQTDKDKDMCFFR